jgi:hypothetical protein
VGGGHGQQRQRRCGAPKPPTHTPGSRPRRALCVTKIDPLAPTMKATCSDKATTPCRVHFTADGDPVHVAGMVCAVQLPEPPVALLR